MRAITRQLPPEYLNLGVSGVGSIKLEKDVAAQVSYNYIVDNINLRTGMKPQYNMTKNIPANNGPFGEGLNGGDNMDKWAMPAEVGNGASFAAQATKLTKLTSTLSVDHGIGVGAINLGDLFALINPRLASSLWAMDASSLDKRKRYPVIPADRTGVNSVLSSLDYADQENGHLMMLIYSLFGSFTTYGTMLGSDVDFSTSTTTDVIVSKTVRFTQSKPPQRAIAAFGSSGFNMTGGFAIYKHFGLSKVNPDGTPFTLDVAWEEPAGYEEADYLYDCEIDITVDGDGNVYQQTVVEGGGITSAQLLDDAGIHQAEPTICKIGALDVLPLTTVVVTRGENGEPTEVMMTAVWDNIGNDTTEKTPSEILFEVTDITTIPLVKGTTARNSREWTAAATALKASPICSTLTGPVLAESMKGVGLSGAHLSLKVKTIDDGTSGYETMLIGDTGYVTMVTFYGIGYHEDGVETPLWNAANQEGTISGAGTSGKALWDSWPTFISPVKVDSAGAITTLSVTQDNLFWGIKRGSFPIGVVKEDIGGSFYAQCPASWDQALMNVVHAYPSNQLGRFRDTVKDIDLGDPETAFMLYPSTEDIWMEQHKYELEAAIYNYSHLRNVRIVGNPEYGNYPYYGEPQGFFRNMIADLIPELVELHWKSDNPFLSPSSNVVRISEEKYDMNRYQAGYNAIFDSASAQVYPIDPRAIIALQRNLVTRRQSQQG
jgi:hypothetical protein